VGGKFVICGLRHIAPPLLQSVRPVGQVQTSR
jgi:hypothetical protein